MAPAANKTESDRCDMNDEECEPFYTRAGGNEIPKFILQNKLTADPLNGKPNISISVDSFTGVTIFTKYPTCRESTRQAFHSFHCEPAPHCRAGGLVA